MFFSDLFNKTRSGRDVVTKISGGMVEPLKSWPGISARTSKFKVLFSFRAFVRWCKTELCRQVNLPCLRATGQKFRMCSRVPLFPHKGHLDTNLLPPPFEIFRCWQCVCNTVQGKGKDPPWHISDDGLPSDAFFFFNQ